MNKNNILTNITILLLALLSFNISFGQAKKHLVLVNDGNKYKDCTLPLNKNDQITVTLTTVNIEDPFFTNMDCAPFRIAVYAGEEAAILIGFSQIIWPDANGWSLASNTGSECDDFNTYLLYEKAITIGISFDNLPCKGTGPSEITKIHYEIVEASPDNIGSFTPYINNNPICAGLMFNEVCFDHHTHEGEEANSENHSHNADKSYFCYSCTEKDLGEDDNDNGFDPPTDEFPLMGNRERSVASGALSEAGLETFSAIHISPNPFSAALQLEIITDQETLSDLTVMDMNGRMVFQQQLSVIAGRNRFELDMATLPSGIYVLRYWNGHEWQSEKVVKR